MLAYALAILLLVSAVIGVLLVREQHRRRQELQMLMAVMRQAMDDGPLEPAPRPRARKPRGKD